MRGRGRGCGCLGCGGGSLLVLGLLGALAWMVVIQPARSFLEAWRLPAQTQTQTQTNTGEPGTPSPASSTQANAPLTRADVERFVGVRRQVAGALGPSLTGVQQVWTDIQNGQTPNIWTVTSLLGSVGSSIGQARQAQATALSETGMSPERYAEVRQGVNRALGLPEVDFARAAEALQRGQLPDLSTTVQTATAQDRALVTPFRAELTRTAALGLLGL